MLQIVTDHGLGLTSWQMSSMMMKGSLTELNEIRSQVKRSYHIKILENVYPYFLTDSSGRREIMGQFTRLSRVNNQMILEACDMVDDEKIMLFSLALPRSLLYSDGQVPGVGLGIAREKVELVYLDTSCFAGVVNAIFKFSDNEYCKSVGPRTWVVEPFLELVVPGTPIHIGQDGKFHYSEDERLLNQPKYHRFLTWNSISPWHKIDPAEEKILQSYLNNINRPSPSLESYFGDDYSEEIRELAAKSRSLGMNQRCYIYRLIP